jgi:hypothetical protein
MVIVSFQIELTNIKPDKGDFTMKKFNLIFSGLAILSIFLLSLLFFSCSKDPTSPAAETGTIKIYLTDAPAAYDAVNIVVNRVEVHKSDVSGSDSGWVVINDQPVVYNLLEFRNGVTAVLGDAELAAAHYTQMRLVIDPGSHVIVEGNTFDLIIPSGDTSGFKFTHAFTIEENDVYELMVDFEVKRSVFLTGSDRYTLQPTLRLVPTVISGTVSGTLLPPDSGSIVWTMVDSDSVFAYPDDTGYFKLMALPEGQYDVNIFPGSIDYSAKTISNVTVSREANTDLGTINL